MVKPGFLEWVMKPREKDDLVFCHNDLSTNNIIVDPETLKVKAVIDWEYAGFFPPGFEGMFFKRVGPSVALEGEHNDEDELYAVLRQNRA
jgi:thiamine kinase-like enzyme